MVDIVWTGSGVRPPVEIPHTRFDDGRGAFELFDSHDTEEKNVAEGLIVALLSREG